MNREMNSFSLHQAYFKVLSQHMSGRMKENHEKSLTG